MYNVKLGLERRKYIKQKQKSKIGKKRTNYMVTFFLYHKYTISVVAFFEELIEFLYDHFTVKRRVYNNKNI